MAVAQGTATDYIDLLSRLRTFVETTLPVDQRYIVQRGVTSDPYEVIWKAPGLSTTNSLYFGIKTYFDSTADYFNWKVNGFIGYVSSNTFETQPGRISSDLGIPLFNQALPYVFVANGQRVIGIVNIENSWESFYLGFGFPNANPSQWPYPLVIGGMLTTAAATRFSDTTHVSWFKGSRANCAMRFVDGAWRTPQVLPYAGGNTLRNTALLSTDSDGYYSLHPLELSENVTNYVNNYMTLDGVYYISGFQNAVGNTLTIDAVDYFVFRDVWRTDLKDYIAVKLA
jgi:hypothetical protein